MSITVGSTFTGVGGADLGLERAGMTIAWQCELDAWKRSVLASHWPDTPIYEDITKLHDPPPVDLLIGGFPCQDLSVAGKRKGFTGERSVLAFDFLRIAESLRPRWLLMENVPGLLSSNGGRDLARLLDEMGTIGYGWAYRILDARYFGVPQRRRRIFICARRTDPQLDTRAAAGLALRALWEGSGGDPTPGWPPRALTTPPVGTGSPHGGSVGTHGNADQHPTGTLTRMYSEQSGQDFGGGQESWRVVCEPDPAGALTKRYAKGVNTTMDDGAIIAHASASDRTNGGGQSQCSAYRKSRRAASMTDDETWVDADHANTLNAFDAGDTRTTHAVVEPISFYPTGGSQNGFWDTTGVSPTIKVGSSVGASNGIAIADALDRQAGGPDDNSAQAGHLIPTGFSAGQSARAGSIGYEPGMSPTLRASASGSNQVPSLHEQMSVRRLTPIECERLMGWPDNWTAPDGVKAPDSKRYAACGDGIVSWCAYWIGMRIQMIETEDES